MKLIKADYFVIAGYLLFMTAHMTTNFLIKHYENEAKLVGVAEEAVLLMEANPLARFFFQFDNFKHIYQWIILPVFYFGMYYYWRKRLFDHPLVLETIGAMLFMMGILNASNDVSILLGVLLK